MDYFSSILEGIILLINLFSVVVLCIGVLFCGISFVQILVAKAAREEKILRLQYMKAELGGYVLLGLEILIVADIILTILHPTISDIVRLAAIVAIRTVISFFLNKEIREIGHNERTSL